MIKRALTLLAALAIVVAALVYLTRRGSRAAETAVLPELLLLAPAESRYLLYADVAALRSSPLLTRLAEFAPPTQAERDYLEFVAATGFDFTRDVDHLVVAARPAAPQPLTVVLAEGRFDRAKISAYALRSGKLERHDSLDVYLFPTAKGARSAAFAFLSANRVALADGPGGAAALAALGQHGEPADLAPAMRQHVERVAGAAFLAVGRIENLAENFSPGGMRSGQFANLARSLRWATLSARPEGERMRLALEGECDTIENARQLSATLDGLRLLGRAALADPRTRRSIQPEAAGALESLLQTAEISRPGSEEEKRVRLALELTPQMIQKLPVFARPPAKLPATPAPSR